MSRKIHILPILLIIGLLTIPMLSYACKTATKKVEKSCCSKEEFEKTSKLEKDCCKKSSSKQEKNCNGKCKHSSCHCYSSSLSFILPLFTEVKSENPTFDNKEQKIHHNNNHISSGFYFIWLPPKIS